MTSDAKVAFLNENSSRTDILKPYVAEPNINGSFPPIDNLEYFPEKVLLNIFSKVDDRDLLHLSDCSYRFEGIARITFKRRYASKHFVFDGDTRTKRRMYCNLFERFGRYANISAIEVKSIRNMNENHWVSKLLSLKTNQLKKLKFYRCWIKGINNILSQHINITHLTIRLSIWNHIHRLGALNHRLKLPNYRNLKHLDVSENFESSLCDERTILRVVRNNPGLEILILSRCQPIIPICCISTRLKHLKELDLVSCMGLCNWDIHGDMPNETIDSIADSLKHLESLRLTIYNRQHMQLVKRLSLKCKNLKHLELDHDRDDTIISSDEIIRAAAQFRTIESLEFSLLQNSDSMQTLAEYLPTLHRLRHLKIFTCESQYQNAIIPYLLNASPSLKTITISTWNAVTFLSGPKIFLSSAIFKEIAKTIREPTRFLRDEHKQFQNDIGFATNKEFIRCDDQSYLIKNDSISFSIQLTFFFFFLLIMCCKFGTLILAKWNAWDPNSPKWLCLFFPFFSMLFYYSLFPLVVFNE